MRSPPSIRTWNVLISSRYAHYRTLHLYPDMLVIHGLKDAAPIILLYGCTPDPARANGLSQVRAGSTRTREMEDQ
jgi:hypothetical protein